jgi:hypothetical protein
MYFYKQIVQFFHSLTLPRIGADKISVDKGLYLRDNFPFRQTTYSHSDASIKIHIFDQTFTQ